MSDIAMVLGYAVMVLGGFFVFAWMGAYVIDKIIDFTVGMYVVMSYWWDRKAFAKWQAEKKQIKKTLAGRGIYWGKHYE